MGDLSQAYSNAQRSHRARQDAQSHLEIGILAFLRARDEADLRAALVWFEDAARLAHDHSRIF